MINGILSQSSALYQTNRSLDGVQRAASDVQGSGQPQQPELASGRDPNAAVRETTVDATAAGASTQVVQEPGQALGTNVDVVV